MHAKKPVVIERSNEVESELETLGLTPEIVRVIAEASSGAKAEALPIDPITAPGTNAYHAGVRAIRRLLLPKGWRMSRNGNIEATVHDRLGIQLLYQNVDQACTDKDPQAISKKGAGARRLIQAGLQGELFGSRATGMTKTDKIGTKPIVWLVCVSSNEFGLQAEVSCPEVFDGEQYENFSKRIWVLNDKFEPSIGNVDGKDSGSDGIEDFDIRIAKK